ncbi:hypothetical protein [Clostridium sp. Ade.TY]|uniref:hypothetical protein n=1 Tax=Clostridium sp. Ade.TY TaxID=1391647 RepID=UPI000411F49A|nr:hypothetical protein [Clostridium sp. Ade.TY]
MKFSSGDLGRYNSIYGMENNKCSVCNRDTYYMDYWENNNNFYSPECKEKYYNWLKRKSNNIQR